MRRTIAARLGERFGSWLQRRRWRQIGGISVARTAFVARTAQIGDAPEICISGGIVEVDRGSQILDGAILAPYGGSVRLGESVFVGPYCVLYGHGGLTIGKNSLIAAHTVIIPSNHGFADRDSPIATQPATSVGIHIGEDVWLGAGVRVLDGVTIGRGCVVAAGAVVTKSLPDYAIAVGVPARVIRYRGQTEPGAASVDAPEDS